MTYGSKSTPRSRPKFQNHGKIEAGGTRMRRDESNIPGGEQGASRPKGRGSRGRRAGAPSRSPERTRVSAPIPRSRAAAQNPLPLLSYCCSATASTRGPSLSGRRRGRRSFRGMRTRASSASQLLGRTLARGADGPRGGTPFLIKTAAQSPSAARRVSPPRLGRSRPPLHRGRRLAGARQRPPPFFSFLVGVRCAQIQGSRKHA